MNPAILEALEKVRAEETRLEADAKRVAEELAKVRAVRTALEAADKVTTVTPKKAPKGMIESKILSVLDRRHPKSNREIREAIQASGYEFSLSPLHITKHLIKLKRGKKVERHGDMKNATYTLGKVA